MVALNLKLFYLRTREKRLSQAAVAEELDVRQATISYLERGQTSPAAALLLRLCHYFDVTPTWLVDTERDIPPLPTERWRHRNALLTVGMWIEAPPDSVEELADGAALCPLLPGAAFFDDEAARIRRSGEGVRSIRARIAALAKARARLHAELAAELEAELGVHPRQRGPAPTTPRRTRRSS